MSVSVRNGFCYLTRFAHLAHILLLQRFIAPQCGLCITVVSVPRARSIKIHSSATLPLYLVCFLLDTTLPSRNNPPHLAGFRPRDVPIGVNGHWGEAHAIPAGMDCAMHQSGVLRTWPLVARSSFRSQCWFGILPVVRQLIAGGAAAHRPAPPYEASFARRAPATPASPALTETCGPRQRLR